ncbi:hypothetical protein [Klenkia brasiliensis]|uniref:Uncharacterized protein n=1 Tax=Klenkia brasiliensis TaxID=333142 RepID=A0A1G7SQW6_9ACTN|nr:hypothetical protein [Klenkia brasiliensis]SDG25368.1 hypothetical protein SAMN05660324_2126 [Klenkia brasiliensis]
MTVLLAPVGTPAPPRVVPVPPRPAVPPPARRVPWADVRWAVLATVLGPVAGRHPDVAIALVGAVDEAVAAGRAQWRRRTVPPTRR